MGTNIVCGLCGRQTPVNRFCSGCGRLNICIEALDELQRRFRVRVIGLPERGYIIRKHWASPVILFGSVITAGAGIAVYLGAQHAFETMESLQHHRLWHFLQLAAQTGGLCMAYFSTAVLLHGTRVKLLKNWLFVRKGPLKIPFRKNLWFHQSKIRQVDLLKEYDVKKRREFYRLRITDTRGQSHHLLDFRHSETAILYYHLLRKNLITAEDKESRQRLI